MSNRIIAFEIIIGILKVEMLLEDNILLTRYISVRKNAADIVPCTWVALQLSGPHPKFLRLESYMYRPAAIRIDT